MFTIMLLNITWEDVLLDKDLKEFFDVFHMGTNRDDVNHCDVLTQEKFHFIAPLYLCYHDIQITKERLITTGKLVLPVLHYILGVVHLDTGGNILSHSWSVHLGKPGLPVPPWCRKKEFRWQLGGSLECSVDAISDTRTKWYLFQIIGVILNINLAVITNLIIFLRTTLTYNTFIMKASFHEWSKVSITWMSFQYTDV